MLGLLEKARTLRKSLGLGGDDREEFAFDPDSGITREEQKEIRAEIEKVASGSRIAVKPEMFAVKAAKRGVLFPVMVIVGAVVVLGALAVHWQHTHGQTAPLPAAKSNAPAPSPRKAS